MTLRIGAFATLLQVFDMPTSLAFYRDVLGFEVESEVPDDGQCDWVLLTLHGSELMLNTAYESDQRPEARDPMRIAARPGGRAALGPFAEHLHHRVRKLGQCEGVAVHALEVGRS